MIFGYSTNAYVKYSVKESLERIAALGFNGVEIMCDRPHLYPPDFDAAALADLKSVLDSCHLQVTNLNSFTLFAVGDTYLPSWIEPEAERRAIRVRHTLECLDVAQALGARNISIPPGGPLEKGMTRQEAFRLFYEGLEQVLPTAEERSIKVLVEPEPDLLMEKTSEFTPFIKEVRSPAIGLNFDIGHFFCAGEDPAERLLHLLRLFDGLRLFQLLRFLDRLRLFQLFPLLDGFRLFLLPSASRPLPARPWPDRRFSRSAF